MFFVAFPSSFCSLSGRTTFSADKGEMTTSVKTGMPSDFCLCGVAHCAVGVRADVSVNVDREGRAPRVAEVKVAFLTVIILVCP